MKIWEDFLKLKWWGKAIVIFIVLGIINVVFDSGSSNDSTPKQSAQIEKAPEPQPVAEAPKSELDIMTKRSCADWILIIGEGAKGLKTEEEIRAGMKEVYDVAQYSVDADIVETATRQLAAITAGDIEAFGVASQDFGNACKAHGAL